MKAAKPLELAVRSRPLAGTAGAPMISRRATIGAMALLGAATLASANFVRAQPQTRSSSVRRLGALLGPAESDPEGIRRAASFEQGLRELGWVAGSNLRIDYRWAAGETDLFRRFARELVDLQPEAILANSGPALEALSRTTGTIPIVFALVSNPAVRGFVENLAHPGGNITGFAGFDFQMGGKWLETLREIAVGVTRVALLGHPGVPPYEDFWHPFEARARQLAIEPIRAPARSESEVVTATEALGSTPGSGLIVMPDVLTMRWRDLIIRCAERYRLPTVYPYRYFVESGGLISDGIDSGEVLQRSASYVDRILKGARTADLPVQQPTKFELTINLKTAKTLGLAVPPVLRSRADAVIE
jgi:putative tryptophan/tyrosine transport system substrate-binding protein